MYTVGIIIAISIAVFVVIYFLTGDGGLSTSSGTPGDFWTCSGKGCKQHQYGEYKTKKQCVNTCKSYVNERNEGCKITTGIPWNSFSDLNACHRYT